MFFDNPRVKGWVKTLLEHQEPLERAAGGRLGPVLGCGHWGCVVDLLDTPYVLKLTVDPTEAHVWSKISELIEEERYGDDGFPRLKRIFELQPGIPYGRQGRVRRAYGIVREKIAVVWGGRGYPNESDFTRTQLRSDFARKNFRETIQALQNYRSLAIQWHKGPRAENDTQSVYLERVIYQMNGPIGGPLGESLGMLLSNDVVLNDVHLNNIGWRFLDEVEGVEGYPCLVIFDPGHTPTAKRELPREQWRQLALMG